jgi:hypothetical protein
MTETTFYFTTKSDLAGANQIKNALNSVGIEATNIQQKASGVTSSFDSVAKRMSQPLRALAFAGMAEGALGATSGIGKLSTGTMALQRGIGAASNALMMFNPLLASVLIGGFALFQIFEKIRGSAEEGADAIIKKGQALQLDAEAGKKAAENLFRLGEINNQQKKSMEDLSNLKEKQLSQLRTETAGKERKVAQDIRELETTHVFVNYLGKKLILSEKDLAYQKKMNDLKERQKELQSAINAMGSSAKPEMSKEDEAAIMEKAKDIANQYAISRLNLADATRQYNTDLAALNDVEKEISQTTSPRRLKDLEKEYDRLLKLTNLEGQRVTKLKTQAKEQINISKMVEDAVYQTMDNIQSAYENGEGKVDEILKNMGAAQVKTVGETLVKMLTAKGISYMAEPFTIPIGLACFAAAGVVAGLTGAAAGALSGSSSKSETGGGTTTSEGGNTGNPINLTIKLEGKNVKDKDFMAIMAGGLNRYVIENNGTVVSSKVKGNTATPGVLAG